jgi:pilus assembly protein CpaB
MSSSLRLSIIMVLLLATAALGLIAYNMNPPKPAVQVTQNTPTPLPPPAPVTIGYFVAAHPLPAGTLARDEDFTVRSVPSASVPSGAIVDTPEARIGLRGSLVRQYLDTGSPVTSQDVFRPRDRGFLASVLVSGSRAVSINVDAESGVSGLIRPGDYVDVVLTQVVTTFHGAPRPQELKDKADDKADLADLAHRTDLATRRLSETVLYGVRVIAVDQEIMQGGPANSSTASKMQTVSLQVAPEQVEKITVAKELGKLSFAIRAAVEQQDTGGMVGRDVPPEIGRPSATVVGHAGDKAKKYALR